MSDVDHAARAREILDAAVESADAIAAELNAPLGADPRDHVEEIDARVRGAEHRLASLDRMHVAAQVHATLAVAEQQRAANLIAYWQLHTPRTTEGSLDDTTIDVRLIDGLEEDTLREIIGLPPA
jgi:hypothetical protein